MTDRTDQDLLTAHFDAFDERNLALHLLLGLESYGQQLDEIVKRLGDEPNGDERVNERFVLFVLGLIAIRRKLGSELKLIEQEVTATMPAHHSPPNWVRAHLR